MLLQNYLLSIPFISTFTCSIFKISFQIRCFYSRQKYLSILRNMSSLQGKLALITGAASGIGLACGKTICSRVVEMIVK